MGVLLLFFHPPLPISNPQQIGEGRKGHLKGFKKNTQPDFTQFQRLSPSPIPIMLGTAPLNQVYERSEGFLGVLGSDC